MNYYQQKVSYHKKCKKIFLYNKTSVFGLDTIDFEIEELDDEFSKLIYSKSNINLLESKVIHVPFRKYNFIPYSNMIISTHVLPGMMISLNSLANTYPDNYLVCIQYFDKQFFPKKKILQDVQIGVTETLTKDEYSTLDKDSSIEKLKPVIDRAIKEEFCKIISNCECTKSNIYTDNNRNLYSVSLKLDENSKVKNIKNVISFDKNNDCDNKSKIMLFIHGPLHIMKKIFSKFSTTEEEIGSYVLVKLSDAPSIFFS